MKILLPGTIAPDFALPDQQGEIRRLSDYRGQWLVLYFYPKDQTPGCTKEACAFRDGYRQLRALGAMVIGVSLDSPESHAKFAAKYHLPFPLLADSDAEVSRAYGALWSLGPLRFSRRHSFIIDPESRIARSYRKVDAENHATQVLADFQGLIGKVITVK